MFRDPLAMQRLAAIDHREHRQDGRTVLVFAAEMIGQLGERALGERRGDERHHEKIDGAEQLVGKLGKTWRAIEDDPIIILLEGLQQLLKTLGFFIEQLCFEVPERAIGCKNIETGKLGRLDQWRKLAIGKGLARRSGSPEPHREGGSALRVQIP
ncbi:hypothetical protein GCM10007973_13900 [Polymorphobacter multimanifer]|nr:hypothetical protein GCM10007973_13900 [Polymorphobacter multimanifer]